MYCGREEEKGEGASERRFYATRVDYDDAQVHLMSIKPALRGARALKAASDMSKLPVETHEGHLWNK